jgi:predicted RNA-binding Zn-ribbon protein involved in translation (DUF1610 family)
VGESTAFHCNSCGYRSASIRWGVSAIDPRRRFLPARCFRCNTYVEIDLSDADLLVDTFRCPTCDEEVSFVEKADSYCCPQCGAPDLKMEQGPSYW